VTARGDRIEVRLNGEPEPVIQITDGQWKSGAVGVRIFTKDNDRPYAAFDDVRVTPLGAEAPNGS
jgi:hypothetical protein